MILFRGTTRSSEILTTGPTGFSLRSSLSDSFVHIDINLYSKGCDNSLILATYQKPANNLPTSQQQVTDTFNQQFTGIKVNIRKFIHLNCGSLQLDDTIF